MKEAKVKRRKVIACGVFMILITSLGCVGKVRYPSYYALNLPAPPDPPKHEGVRAVVAVREFRSPGYLKQGALVYRPTPEQIGFYNYHHWAVDPRELVTNAVEAHLRASGMFSQVRTYDGHSDTDYVITGRLERLEEIDYEGGVKVAVEISAQMTSIASGVTVWSNQVTEIGPVEGRNVPAVVTAMNQTLDVAIGKLFNPPPGPATTTAPLGN
jgi:ABC-type uncharacterized transport system auxiliary subunit